VPAAKTDGSLFFPLRTEAPTAAPPFRLDPPRGGCGEISVTEPTPTLSHTHSTVVITPIYLFADDRDIALRRIKYPIPFEKEPVQYLFELFLGRWRQVARNHYLLPR
jgi:hypothetical protein